MLLAATCLSACLDRRELSDDPYGSAAGTYYLSLNINMLTTSRAATPTPGETGNGTEGAVRNESTIKNINIFIIRAGDGLDAASGTTFLYSRYFTSTSEEWTTQLYGADIKFKTGAYIPQEGDKVLVVANAGPLTGSITTLGQLRDYTTYQSWYQAPSLVDNDMFVMSSAYNDVDDGKVILSSHEGSFSDPYVSVLNIQRTAARIDFMYRTDNFTGSTPSGELTYIVKDSHASADVATVHLENIIPVNLMQEPSYLIKRVTTTSDITSTVKYGYRESGSEGVAPSTYVIEPHTLSKQSTVDATTLNNWYGTTRAATIFANPSLYLTNTGINSYVATHTTASPAELGIYDRYFTLAYTNENTQSKEKHLPDFMTGLLLKTIYEPRTVYSDASLTVASYTKGTTFWRYSPTNTLMSEENSKYFTTEAAATAYKTAHPLDMAEITKYENGVCYYNIWLRHANVDADPHLTFPMEYGIVRNNIYRVGVEKFTGPGTPTPSYEAPDHLYLRIFVRPWNRREHSKIIL